MDIDSVDADDLWELDRFVCNYKKTLSKHKRKAELAMLARAEAKRHNQLKLNGGVSITNWFYIAVFLDE